MLTDQVQKTLAAIEEKLNNVVTSDITLLDDASRHIISSGGKRVRPRLAILAYEAAGGKDISEVIALAAAIELVHTATLVHDDINDHSAMRRGRPTVHARYGRTFALLTGDYLFTKVYEMMAPYGADFNVIMAEACVRLVEGETLQAQAAKAGEMDRETYKTIISRKTASLFEAAARMGAMLGGADEKLVESLATFGYNLGLTFQITDDILDIVGDEMVMGKPVGADVAQSRGVAALHEAVANGHGTALTAVAEQEVDPIQALMSRLRESGAVDVARMQAQEMAQRANKALAQVPASPAKVELQELLDSVLNRDS